jgi:serine phosphatase RsbU (regulator of sigma subunit)/catechol 2,3-dioxygenase-like lactoylglutathione lyase family enzyme
MIGGMSAPFSAAWAQPPGPGPGGPEARDPHLRVHAVRVFVRDQERSLRFYLDKLGFTLAYDARLQSGQRWVAVSPPDGSTVLSLIEPGPKSAERKLIGRATQVVFVTEDFPAKFHEWHQRGVRFRHTPRLTRIKYDRRASSSARPGHAGGPGPVWGGMFARFEDLDGNSFTLASFDEESRAVEAQRRALAETREAERRVVHELEIARQVQARLFPQRLPPSRTLDYAGHCIQARQVGGDYYDFLDLGQDRLGLVVGDIAGKGIAAALLMAHLQATLRSQCAVALQEPERFLRSVNQLFCENTIESAYATLFFAEYDDRRQRLRYANCGHLCGLLLRQGGGVERLGSTSTVLGLFDDWECGIGEQGLGSGDVLALYTDGVTEAFNEKGDEFGEDRLIDSLGRSREGPAQSMLQSVVEDVHRFSPHEQHDDITLIVARCRA